MASLRLIGIWPRACSSVLRARARCTTVALITTVDLVPPEPPTQQKRVVPVTSNLTPREMEVLGLLAQGKSNPDIAAQFVISRATVKVHVERIIRKLGVSDRTQAVVRAIETGLITPETRSR